ncbi:ribonucleases p/MRP protein subunit domain-containing protein [Hirsutella rhossiliensis]|uniref:Ribonucleases p/MRP protein subunit domain-containing protein n=1 Tax=Hirsutella rhossiliensis TaxID=111463 RepID=A0A9P8SKN4_9HYPO|nr:ribonucleases p/MRP protein subunit domain-containing protein [Hirsutella rhossiliensis]KAH0964311.1 ribonucleases p/MRP protein subunit domain-containing protein [Hirsutella rhossiliensis]
MGPKAPAGGPNAPPSNKRSIASHPTNARNDVMRQKRAKLHAARNIPVQQADAALKDGQLDLQAFVAAHEFEIESLEQSMATSKAVGSSRAFQKVPRGLRRRTASHNPKRVPRRLKARARREMVEDNTPLVEARRRKPTTTRARIRAETAKKLRVLAARKKKRQAEASQRDGKQVEVQGVVGRKPRPKIRRNQLNEPPQPAAKFRKRQINKTWLPTHTWHAKRARMTDPQEPLWRFAIPLTPNEKIYRPTHRAQGERGTMIWDMSYVSTIGVYGSPDGLEKVLKRVGISQPSSWGDSLWGEKGRRWRSGTRVWSGMLSRESGRHQRLMCPATVLWNPDKPGRHDHERDKIVLRQVYLRVHPSAFLEVFNELLRLTKMTRPRVYIEDLRFEVGSIELTGPASTEALLAVLTPYVTKDSPRSSHAALFESLEGLTNPATLPANAVLSFSVQDPRLRHPPRKRGFPAGVEAQMALLSTMARWPAEEGREPSLLFDRDARHCASCLPSQKSINRRRGNTAAGSFLAPTKADPPIPVILIASRSASGMQTQGTWTLLAPWKCILPVWYSLVHVPLVSGLNPRFGGMNEARQVAFERGLPWFPGDHPATDAGAEWELEQRRKRRQEWERRPKSKRTEWAALDLGAGRKGEVGDGHACDFELLFGLPTSRQDETPEEETDSRPEIAENGPTDTGQGAKKSHEPAKKGTDTPSLKKLSLVTRTEFDSIVALVRISLLSRGVVRPCARIYRLPSPPPPCATSPDAEVPATMPPPRMREQQKEQQPVQAANGTSCLPHDLRAQWLVRIPPTTAPRPADGQARGSPARPAGDVEARKRLLARELVAAPPPAPNLLDVGGGGHHALVPDAADLVGFVSSGSFCLADGRAAAIGCVAVGTPRRPGGGVLADVRADARAGRLCVVRNAGENVGWLARWEAV